ncbi:MAG: nucleotidyltransferase family protein [Gammaproteobacteria bacterium]|nr:nucleotidyltransferase family protein [Gammaproteobacteria bacterium]
MANNICIAVLAAGQARRFGASKLLQLHDSRPLLQYALAAATEAFPGNVYLVTGHDAGAIAKASSGFACHEVFNPDFENGIGTSIAKAADTCATVADALIIGLADQPLITATHLAALARAWSGDGRQIVATEFSATLGPPVLFGRDFFAELAGLKGDRGAKDVLRRNSQAVVAVEFEPALIDIDTPADLEALDSC